MTIKLSFILSGVFSLNLATLSPKPLGHVYERAANKRGQSSCVIGILHAWSSIVSFLKSLAQKKSEFTFHSAVEIFLEFPSSTTVS